MHLHSRAIKIFALGLCFFITSRAFSQTFWEKSHIGVGFGAMKYMGDIPRPFTKFAIQGSYTYELTDHINIRGQAFFGSLGASDNPSIVNPAMDRPHPFETRIQEASILGEYNLLNMNDGKKWTPYGFIGIGFFHFTPYYTQYDAATNRYNDYGYPITSSKKLNIPFGGGFKYALTDNIRLFAEGSFRYTTTDEIDGYVPTMYPGYTRAKANDYFYSLMLGVTFRLGGDYSRKDGGSGSGKSKFSDRKCPPVY